MSRNYDNWDRLVEAVLRREKDRQLAYCESLSTCYSANLSSRFSFDSAVEDVHLPPEVPGIVGLHITGVAKPGGKLQGSGYSVRGTCGCTFQWIRQYPDGTIQYIEGATHSDYVVTDDDVDTFVSLECIPMDELGRQGDLVRSFGIKITCDREMQEEIDGYISQGLATFKVLIHSEDSEKWEPATLLLRRSGFQVEVGKNTIISESYSKELSIIIPSGLSAQLVLTCSNGSSYPLSTNNDIRMRDTLVLTMRIFQTKFLKLNARRRHPGERKTGCHRVLVPKD